MNELIQPILARHPEPEPSHQSTPALTLDEFLVLLTEEEDYFAGDQHNTKLMITRLRKIFYDQWGWNTELIRLCAHIEGRYEVKLIDDPSEHPDKQEQLGQSKKVRRYKNNQNVPKHRLVTYRADDRVYGSSRVGKVPFIYQNDHQEIRLPDGHYCDIAHVLAGLDAYNHQQIVSPLPNFLHFLQKLAPHVDSNIDIVTWLGDIASSSGDFLFAYLHNQKQPIGLPREQHFINVDAPGSDMLGDIDTYVIRQHYAVGSEHGQRVTEIFRHYYVDDPQPVPYRHRRFSSFCQAIGLRGWNGHQFANEATWLAYYRKQLRDNTSFQIFSLTDETIKSIWLPLAIWFNGYRDVLKLELLLELFLKALKELINQEPTPTH